MITVRNWKLSSGTLGGQTFAAVKTGERPTAQRPAARGALVPESRRRAVDAFVAMSGGSSESEKRAAVKRDLKVCEVRRR